jgi:hypothetical protein
MKTIETVGGRIHEIMNQTLSRKLTIEEYKRVIRDMAWVFKIAQEPKLKDQP